MAKGNFIISESKIFVLDTSVILYDHNAFQNFQEHDVAIPIQVLEELDNLKSGNDTRNYEARSFIRLMDELSKSKLINKWVPLKGKGRGSFKIVMDDIPSSEVDLIASILSIPETASSIFFVIAVFKLHQCVKT